MLRRPRLFRNGMIYFNNVCKVYPPVPNGNVRAGKLYSKQKMQYYESF